MSKILIIAYPPPPLAGKSKIEAAHYRSWQFLLPILEVGNQVHLCTPQLDVGCVDGFVPDEWQGKLDWSIVPFHKLNWIKQLQRIHDAYDPDCIIAVNFDCCLYATKLKTQKPVWMDIYGDYLTIMQASYYWAGSNRGMNTSIMQMKEVLRKGDIYSTCGNPQSYALVGELAITGRLTRQTFGYEFTRVVLPGSPPTGLASGQISMDWPESSQIKADDFSVLWCGGYNTWTDVETLFRGLEWAVERDSTIQFVSLGASTYDSADNSYSKFLNMIKASPHNQQYHMLGWQPWEEIGRYYGLCKVGLSIDALHYETLLGTRTRLVEMIAAGLPVITSVGTELSYLLQGYGAALTFEIGDWQALGEEILVLAKSPHKHGDMAQQALNCARDRFSFSKTTIPILEWVENPQRAPDRVEISKKERLRNLEYAGRGMVRRILWGAAGLRK